MTTILDSLYKDFIRPYYFPVMILFLMMLFGVAGYYAYNTFYMPKEKVDKLGKNVANANTRNKEVELMMFSADWCPHCKNARPIWEETKSKYSDTLVNNQKVVFVDVNCTDDADPKVQSLIQQYGIQGFPSVKMVYNNPDGTPTTVDFDAKISKYSLEQFIETVLNQ
jgi:thiol-disulfide isomerase/thioredoxin